MKKEIVNLSYQLSFCDGKYTISTRHACSSCGLTEEEWNEVRSYNDGINAASQVMIKMEEEIINLNNEKVRIIDHIKDIKRLIQQGRDLEPDDFGDCPEYAIHLLDILLKAYGSSNEED